MSTSHEVMKLFHLKGSFCRTHVELMPVAGLLLEDVPMLVLASLYGLSQYTCSTGSIIASSDALVPILISSIGTALATFWRLMLTLLRFRDQGGKIGGERTTPISANCRNINSNSSYADKHKGSSTLETPTRRVTGSSSNVEGTHKQEHTNTQCQRSDCTRSRCSLMRWLQTCYKIFIFLFGLAICILSILVVVGVTYLMVEQNPLFVHRPRDPLVIFSPSDSSPSPHPLANISDVIDNDRVALTYENRCLLVFQYKATQHKIVYNFADINTSEEHIKAKGTSGNVEGRMGEMGTWCEERLSDLFYGSYRDGESGVEVFHELCIAVHVVLPQVTAKPVRDSGLEIEAK